MQHDEVIWHPICHSHCSFRVKQSIEKELLERLYGDIYDYPSKACEKVIDIESSWLEEKEEEEVMMTMMNKCKWRIIIREDKENPLGVCKLLTKVKPP